MRVLRLLRRMPGRLHGGEVLHRHPARRPRPGVRPWARRSRVARGGGRPTRRGRRSHPQRSGSGVDRPAAELMRNAWFETVAEAQRRAKKRLPKSVYSALLAGSEAGVTYRDNIAAFAELGFAPHIGGLFAQRETATTVMGQQISMPVLLSPT